MDDASYQHIASDALEKLESMLDDVDADDCDVERSGDVLTLTFKDGKKAVVNTQRPTRQIWMAANARAWHFSYDEAAKRWLDDKGQNVELFTKLAEIVLTHANVTVTPPA